LPAHPRSLGQHLPTFNPTTAYTHRGNPVCQHKNFPGESGKLRDPFISLCYARLAGLPPLYIQARTDETFPEDSRLCRADHLGLERYRRQGHVRQDRADRRL
jgi:hypothetical protein